MRLWFPLLALLVSAGTAQAKPWTVDYENSTLTFSGSQAGTPFLGSFKHFTTDIDFDPANPNTGSITVEIDMASASIADDDEQNDALPTDDWFATTKFPHAVFKSTAIRNIADNRYEARGNLTIRDITHPAILPFTLTPEGDATRANGAVGLMRNAYKLGGDQWADEQWIAYPVVVTYSILATPQNAQ